MAGEPRSERAIRRAVRVAGGAFLLAIVGSIGLFVVYVAGGDTQLEGLLLFLAFGGGAVAVTVWAKILIDEPDLIEERPPMRSSDADRAAFEHVYLQAREVPDPAIRSRRRFLSRLLVLAGASLTAALGLPFLSLGAPPGAALFRTKWSSGSRLVGFGGSPIRPGDVNPGAVLTVFPEGHVGDGESAALLIGIAPQRLQPGVAFMETVEGLLCFSKICTHAGCPVGLYREEVAELLCPCHQSKFKVTEAARPISGPTTRPLPQLSLGVNPGGFLIALGDFEEPVGPEFWNIRRGRRA